MPATVQPLLECLEHRRLASYQSDLLSPTGPAPQAMTARTPRTAANNNDRA